MFTENIILWTHAVNALTVNLNREYIMNYQLMQQGMNFASINITMLQIDYKNI